MDEFPIDVSKRQKEARVIIGEEDRGERCFVLKSTALSRPPIMIHSNQTIYSNGQAARTSTTLNLPQNGPANTTKPNHTHDKHAFVSLIFIPVI